MRNEDEDIGKGDLIRIEEAELQIKRYKIYGKNINIKKNVTVIICVHKCT